MCEQQKETYPEFREGIRKGISRVRSKLREQQRPGADVLLDVAEKMLNVVKEELAMPEEFLEGLGTGEGIEVVPIEGHTRDEGDFEGIAMNLLSAVQFGVWVWKETNECAIAFGKLEAGIATVANCSKIGEGHRLRRDEAYKIIVEDKLKEMLEEFLVWCGGQKDVWFV